MSQLRPGNDTTPFDLSTPVPSARPLSDFSVERVGDDLVILDGETLQYHALNLPAAEIWQACDGTRSSHQIAGGLGLPIELVESTVSELGEAGLLQSPSNRWDSTLNRRRASKLIAAGLLGAVGLPVIKSITAPDAASAICRNQCSYYDDGGCDWFWCAIQCFFEYLSGGACEPITSGAGMGGHCCVCGGAVTLTRAQIEAAVGVVNSEIPEIQTGSFGEEAIPDDPYLATDEDGNVDLEAIDAQATEQAGVQQPATDAEPVEPVTTDESAGASLEPVATEASVAEPAETGSDEPDQEAGA